MKKENSTDTRVAIISIIAESTVPVPELQKILSENERYIIARTGVPYRAKNIRIICVSVDAPQDVINAMAGKIGKISGVQTKTVMSSF
ncbi:MAG: TM1266 family iron-only hydrogenase system putative regulator [Candidatus Gastranaerophilaceae bacterium]